MKFIKSNTNFIFVAMCLISLFIIKDSDLGYCNTLNFDINVVSENSAMLSENNSPFIIYTV
jgi:hypothetical protein